MLDRRTALISMAAIATGSVVPLRPEPDRAKLLRAFCSPESSPLYKDHDLSRLFSIDGYTYGTDSLRVCRTATTCVCEPCDKPGDAPSPTFPIQSVWKKLWVPGEFVPFKLPRLDELHHLTEIGDCPECDGRRVSMGDYYPPQEWFESIEPLLRGYDVDDNSTFDPKCPVCHGRYYNGPTMVRIEDSFFSYSKLKAVAALPDPMVTLSRSNRDALLFVAGEFEGIVMGCKVES